MTQLTEAELLRMREVQAKATNGPWNALSYDSWLFQVKENREFICSARTDWARLTEWALEARGLLAQYYAGTISDAEMVPLVRHLLEES